MGRSSTRSGENWNSFVPTTAVMRAAERARWQAQASICRRWRALEFDAADGPSSRVRGLVSGVPMLIVALISTVALLVWMGFFMMGSLPLLILKHDTPLDARFIRGLFNVYYLALVSTATVGAL